MTAFAGVSERVLAAGAATAFRSVPVRIALLALLAAAAYGGSLDAGVAWDDAVTISGNPAIRGLERPWRFFVDTWTSDPSSWMSRNLFRPLRTVAYAVQWSVFQGAAWGFHLTSLVLHGAGAAAVGWLTQLLFGRGAWTAAALWLLHPALSENVLYLAAQGNLLCLLLCVLAVIGHVKWLRGGGQAARIGSLVAAAGAMLTYEFGALTPVLLLFAELVLWRRGDPPRQRFLVRHLPHWLLLASYLGARAVVVESVPYTSWWGGSPLASVAMELRVFIEAWRLTLLPTSQLPRYYGEDLPAWITLEVAILIHLSLAAAVVLSWKKTPAAWLAPAIVWWYVAQLPTANVLRPNPGYPFAPRFLFLALVLLVSGLAAWLAVAAARQAAAWGVLIAVLVLCVFLDRRQVEVWRNGRTLFTTLVEHNPEDTLARYNLGALLYHGGELHAAASEIEAVRRLDPRFAPASYMLGEILRTEGRLSQARLMYLEALQKTPAHFGSRIRLAQLSLADGQPGRAREWLEPLTYFPDPPPRIAAEISLGLARSDAALGHCSAAVTGAEAALLRWPYASALQFEAGRLLTSCGDPSRGREMRRLAAETAGREYRDMVGEVAW